MHILHLPPVSTVHEHFYTSVLITIVQILVKIINVDTIQIHPEPTAKLLEQMQSH